MFTFVGQLQYQAHLNHEYIWHSAQAEPHLFAGLFAGASIIRLRALRSPHMDTARYQLVDTISGTLPYHSWTVVKGDEDWRDFSDEKQATAQLEPLFRRFAFSPEGIRFTFPLASQEHIFGLGERTGSLDKRGQSFPIWNVDPPTKHNPETLTMYASIPFYIGLDAATGRASGLLVDHTGKVEMDFGKETRDTTTITVEGDSLVIYLFNGPTPEAVLQQYTELTGKMPLPPRWALGHHQCRWSYRSADEVLKVASTFRERQHPCDAIWLDIDYMNGFRNFTWNPETFPDPTSLTKALHDQHLHLVTIIDPGTKIDADYALYQEGTQHDYFCKLPDDSLFQGKVWPGDCSFPDFSQAAVRRWWGDHYQSMLEQGVDGIWNDMNEPSLSNMLEQTDEPSLHGKTMDTRVLHQAGGNDATSPDGGPVTHRFFHNAYGMEMARATREGLQRLQPAHRPFVLSRSGTAGIQRYAAVWTGDNDSSWEHVSLAIRMCLNLNMSGVPFVGMDIGGFWFEGSGELLVRYAQLGALLPFCRNHNAINNPDQEPWAFGEPYESAYRTAIEIRYRLLPYLYTLFHEAATTGAAIVRPLYYHFPNDERAIDNEREFLLGDRLLVAPVMAEGIQTQQVYLPEGDWFDFWSGASYPGQTEHAVEVSLDHWPLFVKGNSILPLGPIVQYADQPVTEPLTINCYLSTDGNANLTLYEDDGQSLAYQQGEQAITNFNCSMQGDSVVMKIEERHQGYSPRWTEYEVVAYAAGHTLQQRVKVGQGKTTVRLA